VQLDGRSSQSCTATFTAMPAPPVILHTLTLTRTGAGDGLVVSTPAGIDCPFDLPTCTATFPAGTEVTLTATPGSRSTLAGWSGACAATGADSASVTMSADATCTVDFGLAPQCTLSVGFEVQRPYGGGAPTLFVNAQPSIPGATYYWSFSWTTSTDTNVPYVTVAPPPSAMGTIMVTAVNTHAECFGATQVVIP
jgi:hypothetical protein